MGQDCEFVPGGAPPENSKACFATYALPEYSMGVDAAADTRLAFQFMSLADDDCDGVLYSTPRVDLTPLTADNEIIQAISNEEFGGGYGTHIEGALIWRSVGTSCSAGIRTFIIGMEGALNDSLEEYASAGGADPAGRLLRRRTDALSLLERRGRFGGRHRERSAGDRAPDGKVNVVLSDTGVETTIGNVPNEAACPGVSQRLQSGDGLERHRERSGRGRLHRHDGRRVAPRAAHFMLGSVATARS